MIPKLDPNLLRTQITNLIRWLVLVFAMTFAGLITLIILERRDVIHIYPEPDKWEHQHEASSAQEAYIHDHKFPANHHHVK